MIESANLGSDLGIANKQEKLAEARWQDARRPSFSNGADAVGRVRPDTARGSAARALLTSTPASNWSSGTLPTGTATFGGSSMHQPHPVAMASPSAPSSSTPGRRLTRSTSATLGISFHWPRHRQQLLKRSHIHRAAVSASPTAASLTLQWFRYFRPATPLIVNSGGNAGSTVYFTERCDGGKRHDLQHRGGLEHQVPQFIPRRCDHRQLQRRLGEHRRLRRRATPPRSPTPAARRISRATPPSTFSGSVRIITNAGGMDANFNVIDGHRSGRSRAQVTSKPAATGSAQQRGGSAVGSEQPLDRPSAATIEGSACSSTMRALRSPRSAAGTLTLSGTAHDFRRYHRDSGRT